MVLEKTLKSPLERCMGYCGKHQKEPAAHRGIKGAPSSWLDPVDDFGESERSSDNANVY